MKKIPKTSRAADQTAQLMSAPPTLLTPMQYTPKPQTFNPVCYAHQHFINQQTRLYLQYIELMRTLSTNSQAQNHPAKKPKIQFDQQDLIELATGKISNVFGPAFTKVDALKHPLRIPAPPYLLADRVTRIDATALSMQPGLLWTELEIKPDTLTHLNHLPAGLLVETAQANMILINWLGANLALNEERHYRLVELDFEFHASLPKIGSLLSCEIKVDKIIHYQGRLLFNFKCNVYHDSKLIFAVTLGRAGFFSHAELDRPQSTQWQADTAKYSEDIKPNPPLAPLAQLTFDSQAIKRLIQGDLVSVFGEAFNYSQTHLRTPTLPDGKLQLLHEVTKLDFNGGPKQRGYLKACYNINPDAWFFKAHFKDDPCMPGTLAFEGGLQAMMFYLIAHGDTLKHDSWRFEPLQNQPVNIRCYNQVLMTNKKLTYEVFVDKHINDPTPTLYAYLLIKVDSILVMQTYIGIRLVPDWPLANLKPSQTIIPSKKSAAKLDDDLSCDINTMLACAWGAPTEMYGTLAKDFDLRQSPTRLPGPPYHFLTQVNAVDKTAAKLNCEYLVPNNAWYYAESANFMNMPIAALLEAGLQPCGWLMAVTHYDFTNDAGLKVRNLSGSAEYFHYIPASTESLDTDVQLTKVLKLKGTKLFNLNVAVKIKNQIVFNMQTEFGYFNEKSLLQQQGISEMQPWKKWLTKKTALPHKLSTPPWTINTFIQRNLAESCLPNQRLKLIDHISGYWQKPDDLIALLRGERDVHPSDWYFKTHFFQDPVQPGSLGIQAMQELIGYYLMHQNPQIEFPIILPKLPQKFSWKYRGQILPQVATINILAAIKSKPEEHCHYVNADASLWINGVCIYSANDLSYQINNAPPNGHRFSREVTLDQEKQPWLKDHCPTYTLPVLPMMSIVDQVVDFVSDYFPNQKVIAIRQLKLLSWIIVNPSVKLKQQLTVVNSKEVQVELFIINDSTQLAAQGMVEIADQYPASPKTFTPLDNLHPSTDPYQAKNLFHGPSFHIIKSLATCKHGSSSILSTKTTADFGATHQVLLDGIPQSFPRHDLSVWSKHANAQHRCFPSHIESIEFFTDLPRHGDVNCELRYRGDWQNKIDRIHCQAQLQAAGKTSIQIDYVEKLFSLPENLQQLTSTEIARYITEKKYFPKATLATQLDNCCELSLTTVLRGDWLPGTLATIYGATGDLLSVTKEICIKDYFCHKHQVHPHAINITADNYVFIGKSRKKYYYRVETTKNIVRVYDAG
ncbi:MAG: polyketide synthase dehydratase domain-containing protein [Gammaproteobacteria bacterium]|nr:polyketide synthase dehydratase domain-containing protein [Gammaproteobacteria bacterium]